MNNQIEKKGLKYLKQIEEEVSEIESRTPGPKRAFVNGIMQGMGILIGSVLAAVILGWLLSVAGVIPGFRDVVVYLKELSSTVR